MEQLYYRLEQGQFIIHNLRFHIIPAHWKQAKENYHRLYEDLKTLSRKICDVSFDQCIERKLVLNIYL